MGASKPANEGVKEEEEGGRPDDGIEEGGRPDDRIEEGRRPDDGIEEGGRPDDGIEEGRPSVGDAVQMGEAENGAEFAEVGPKEGEVGGEDKEKECQRPALGFGK